MSTLAELFARDPFKCTKEDIAAIVQAYRQKAYQFKTAGVSAAAVKTSSKTKQLADAIATKDLDL
jgi:hypothetical protein